MDAKEQREKIKQERITKYFIEATKRIIKDEGIEAVTIRKVGTLAGYTSATLYNYFDNLTHLIFLANMNELEEYDEKLAGSIEGCKNSIEIYMSICKCYAVHTFNKPDIFKSLFFSQKRDKFEEYTAQYYKLYPEKNKKQRPEFLNELSHVNSIYSRRLYLLNKCVEEGFMEKDNAKDFTDISLRFYRTILRDVKDGISTKEEAIALTLKYDYQLFGFFLKPEYKNLVKEYKKKLLGKDSF